MNLAIRDVKYRFGRFLLTAFGLGLLLATVMAMGGIYRGIVEDGLSLVRAPGADLWVVQKETNGPFAESSRIPDDLYKVIRAVPGVLEASPVAFQSLQLEYESRPIRLQVVGYRPGGLGGPPAVAAGRAIAASRYEIVIDRKAGIPIGAQLPSGRMTFTVVGLTEGIVSSSGDPVAYVSLQDSQELQFLKANEAVRNERARLQAAMKAIPILSDVPASALSPIIQNTHLANAVLVRLDAAAPGEVTRRIEQWNHYRAMTTAEQEALLAKSVIEKPRQQLLLFRMILLAVSTVIIALIIFTMTMEKTRDIATLKVIGAPNWKIGGLILQESLALGLLGYGFGALLINQTYEYFPRRVAIMALDQYLLLAIVVVICVLASVVGIRHALNVDATTAMGGGA